MEGEILSSLYAVMAVLYAYICMIIIMLYLLKYMTVCLYLIGGISMIGCRSLEYFQGIQIFWCKTIICSGLDLRARLTNFLKQWPKYILIRLNPKQIPDMTISMIYHCEGWYLANHISVYYPSNNGIKLIIKIRWYLFHWIWRCNFLVYWVRQKITNSVQNQVIAPELIVHASQNHLSNAKKNVPAVQLNMESPLRMNRMVPWDGNLRIYII